MSNTTKQVKTVQVLARIAFKSDPRKVTYKVRSSDGSKIYSVFVFNGQVSSCDCPAKVSCYHRIQIQEREDARKVAGLHPACGNLMTAREVMIAEVIRLHPGAFLTQEQVASLKPLANYDVQREADKVAALADALPEDAYEQLASTKVLRSTVCGHLVKHDVTKSCGCDL